MLLLGCQNKSKSKSVESTFKYLQDESDTSKYIIEADELIAIKNSDNLKIIDFRKPDDYKTGHIDEAINIWRPDIEDHSFPYKGMMATKNHISSLFSKLGISNKDLLVVYDDRGSCDAARFWWVLQNYDFDAVKILNGGFKAWKEIDGAVNKTSVSFTASSFKLPEFPSYRFLISKEAIVQMLHSDANEIIIDTRTTDEYSGKRQKKGALSGGRIPKSHLIDWSDAIDFNGSLKFKSKDELERIYGKFKASKNHPIVTYCHTGVRSAHTTFVLTQLLGYTNVKNYDGSWSEWSYFKNLPRTNDEITTILK